MKSLQNRHYLLWGDEIFGRHALLSRGWGVQDKRSIEPLGRNTWRPGSTTQLCVMANCLVEVRSLPLQLQSDEYSSDFFVFIPFSFLLSNAQIHFTMKYLFSFLLLSTSIVVYSQTNSMSPVENSKDSVKQVIENMFIAMKNSDTTLFQSCFHSTAFLQTISVNREGVAQIRNENIAAFIKQVGSLPKNAADERIQFSSILVDGDLASVWTPYSFYFNGQFSHCGVNSFQLVRINNVWKIQYCIDTRRKKPC